MTARRILWLLVPLLLAGACGCGRTATIKGKVSFQGRPVVHGSVIFLSADKTARSGVIGPDGSYTVEGVHPGEVRIAVISRDPSKGERRGRARKKADDGPEETANAGWFALPTQLEDPQTSGLNCTVGAGRVSYDIELK